MKAKTVPNRIYDTGEYIRSRLPGAVTETEVIDGTSVSGADEDGYLDIFGDVQQYIVNNRLADLESSLSDNDTELLRNLVTTYISGKYPSVGSDPGALRVLVTRCIDDMTGYGFLNRYFARKDEIEEININAWNIIEVRWCDGRKEITGDRFHSPQHAREVIIRILRTNGKYLDENRIYEISYIGKAVRICTVVTPIADEEIGVAASIRFIHSAVFRLDRLISGGFLTKEMGDALREYTRRGVSVCVCGATGSGKTTVLNALLGEMPDDQRIITLEGGTREFDLIRYDGNGNAVNNRVHLQTRPHRDARLNVDLQLLLDLILKFDPDMVVVGEMVSEEAFIASETARTGHTVMTTIHTNNAYDAYYRMFSLGIRKYTLDEKIMLKFMVDAFPIVVYAKKYPDGQRRIQTILEGVWQDDRIVYNELYRFDVEDNITENGKTRVIGRHVRVNPPTDRLKQFMIDNGAGRAEVSEL